MSVADEDIINLSGLNCAFLSGISLLSGTSVLLSGTSVLLSGTSVLLSGTSVLLSGTSVLLSGTSVLLSRTSVLLSGICVFGFVFFALLVVVLAQYVNDMRD